MASAYPGWIALLVDESGRGSSTCRRQHHVAQPHVARVVCVVGHAAAHAHQQHVLHLLEGAEEARGGAAAGYGGFFRTAGPARMIVYHRQAYLPPSPNNTFENTTLKKAMR